MIVVMLIAIPTARGSSSPIDGTHASQLLSDDTEAAHRHRAFRFGSRDATAEGDLWLMVTLPPTASGRVPADRRDDPLFSGGGSAWTTICP